MNKKIAKKSIVSQLFIITLIVLFTLNFMNMFIIRFVFKEFYHDWNNKNLKKELASIAYKIEGGDFSYSDMVKKRYELFNIYDANLEITDDDGNDIEGMLWHSQPWWRVTVESKKGEKLYFMTSDYTINDPSDELEVGSKIYLTGEKSHGKYLAGGSYIKYSKDMSISKNKNLGPNEFTDTVKVISITKASETEKEEFVYNREYFSFFTPNHDKIFSSLFKKDVKGKSGKTYTIDIGMREYRIDGFTNALSDFYKYFFIITGIVSVLLAGIYSRIISKPLLNICNIAKKMANLDFTEKVNVKTNNEFKELGDSLNKLSNNLDDAMNKLQEDLNEKLHQEKIRREFVANVSHELKTPLSVMRCYIDTVKDSINPEKNDEYYEIILDEIRKMNRLVIQMLELSKVESGDVNLDIKKFKISGMIEDAITLFKPKADKKKISIVTQGEFFETQGDITRIEHVVINLIGNAIIYAEEGTNIVINGIKKENVNKIEIFNKCKPITQEEANELWRRFHKGDRSHNEEGTGLGLAIVAAVLELHKIEYGVRSEKEGLTFYFELPIAE